MPITELLERNADKYPNDVALIEINPKIKEGRRVTWKEYELIESTSKESYRRRSPGASLMRKPTGLPTILCPWVSKPDTR